jgi:hypothetical protein
VQLANDLPRLHELGGDVVAVSVDSAEQNAAMAQRWRLPFPIVSDPGGSAVLQPLDLWNPNERGGIGWPAIVLFDSNGSEVRRLRARDFADRPATNDELLGALRALALSALLNVEPWVPPVGAVEDPSALRVEAFGPYFRGIRFGTRGLASRLTDDHDRAEALAMSDMAAAFLDGWKVRRAE